MATEVTVNLPDNVYLHATRLAQLMNSDLANVLAETIEGALAPLGTTELDLTPVTELSNQELLATSELRMDEKQGKRLGQLLARQENGTLNEADRHQLVALMQVYHECLVRKAQALNEAVRRGLRAPLTS